MNRHMHVPRPFADTRSAMAGVVRLPTGLDRLQARARTVDGDDWTLLRLVLCVAAATLVLALATSLAG